MWLGCNDILILVLFIQFRSLSSWCLTWFETICASLPSTRIHISVLDVMPKSCQAGVVYIGDTHISNSSARQISCLPFGHFHSSRVGKIMPQSNVSWTIRKRNKTRWWWWCALVDFTVLYWPVLGWTFCSGLYWVVLGPALLYLSTWKGWDIGIWGTN